MNYAQDEQGDGTENISIARVKCDFYNDTLNQSV